jgi:hypothetical protein
MTRLTRADISPSQRLGATVDVLSAGRSSATIHPPAEVTAAESAIRTKAYSRLVDIVRLLAREAAREVIAEKTLHAPGGFQATSNRRGESQ